MRLAEMRRLVNVAVVSLMLITAACASSGSSGNTTSTSGVKARTIGYVDIVAQGAMQKRWYDYFVRAAEKLGWKVKLADANGDPATALTQAENFINQHVDALAISCIETGSLRAALDDAKAKNIPTMAIGCGMPAPVDAWSGVYAEDDAGLAKTLAAYMVTKIGAGSEVGILADAALTVGHIRTDLITSELKNNGVKVVATTVVPLTDIVHGSTVATADILNAHPNVKAIMCIYDFFAGPAIAAIQQAGKTSSVDVYSFYADQVNLPLMIAPNSPLKGLVDGPVEQVSLVALDQLLAHFEKGTKIDHDAAANLKVSFKVFTQADHPEFTSGYVSPWPLADYGKPFFDKWNQTYGLNITG